MMSHTHISGSILIASYLSPLLIPDNPSGVVVGIFYGGNIIGSILPDIDTPYSKLGRLFYPLLWPLYLFQRLSKHISGKLYKIVKHKGVLHWLSLWIVLCTLAYPSILAMCNNFFDKIVGQSIMALFVGLMSGIMSHIILDLFAEGVYLFAPFSMKKMVLPLRVRTGGTREHLIFIAILIFLVVRFNLN